MHTIRATWCPAVRCRVCVEEGTTKILTIGKTYKVLYWIQHEYGCDPVIICDQGNEVVMWSGLFHDRD